MSDSGVLADVSDSLRNLLWEQMRRDPKIYPAIIDSEGDITLDSPQDSDESGKLSLFLYLVEKNINLTNQSMIRSGATQLQYPPLPLTLYYLITPAAEEQKKDQILLGKVLQIFHDNAVLRAPVLTGGLEGEGVELRIVQHTMPFEQLLQLWQSFGDKGFRLSLCYQVTPAVIDSLRRESSTPVNNFKS